MSLRTIAILQLATAIGLILFWVGFFALDLAPANPPVGFFEYEHSFPLPDGILAIGLFISGYGLLKAKPYAKIVSLVCAGALLFLGVVDFSFNIQNGMYALSTADLILNAFINIWCLILGGLIITAISKRSKL